MLYLSSESIEVPFPQLPFWGPDSTHRGRTRGSAAALVERLRSVAIDAALAVHPDSTDLVMVVANELPMRRTA
jgi:hypothetical protein